MTELELEETLCRILGKSEIRGTKYTLKDDLENREAYGKNFDEIVKCEKKSERHKELVREEIRLNRKGIEIKKDLGIYCRDWGVDRTARNGRRVRAWKTNTKSSLKHSEKRYQNLCLPTTFPDTLLKA